MNSFKMALGACAAMLVAGPAAAGTVELSDYYFVRPYVDAGGTTLDGIQENGATSDSRNIGSDYQSNVDLATGTIRIYQNTTGPNASGQAVGVFGDTLNFTGGDGSLVDFAFDFDGIINAPAWDGNISSYLQYGVSATLYVFDASSAATYDNYTSIGGALISQSGFFNFAKPTTAAIDEYFARSLSGSVAVTGDQSFKVFASLGTFVSISNQPATVTMDFLHTGAIGVQAPAGVDYSSASGVFLTDTGAVPEPATWAVMILGFGLAGGTLRRRRMITA